MVEQQEPTAYVNPYKFNAKELDSETGLYYYGARYYNPRLSIWYGVDPLAIHNTVMETEFYGDGQHNSGVYFWGNLNPYIYTYQNPIRYIDPNGKQAGAPGLGGVNFNPHYILDDKRASIYPAIGLGFVGAVALDVYVTKGWATRSMLAYTASEAFHSMQMQTHWRDKGNEAEAQKYEAEATKDLIIWGGLSGVSRIARGMASMPTLSRLCFVKGTPVYTAQGLKPIEKIKIGDLVWSFNEKTKQIDIKKVIDISEDITNKLVEINISSEKILCTPEHPFFVNNKWIEAKKLKPGNYLLDKDGNSLKVISVSNVEKLSNVYNLVVEDNHNYFITKSFILVHNGGPCDIAWKKVMNSNEVIKQLEKNGFQEVAQTGSHKKFKYSGSELYVTVADHGKKDIPKGTLSNIKKQVQAVINDLNKK